jgi:iron complex outermembrane receptor protein
MKKFGDGALRGLAYSVSAVALVIAGPALAQNTTDNTGDPVNESDGECTPDAQGTPIATDPDCVSTTVNTDDAAAGEGSIIVTGSRIKRDTYTSVSPLQVIVADDEEAAGLFDPAQILQRSTAASGTQIDATFQGFVLDNGPGSQTVDLRGLGADRTLLLVNGRRLAPSGVEGAPSSPSINLLPGSLIERYDLLLDGASSVYGSDAIAGVGNIILRKDFDGLELFARGEINPYGAGEDYTVSAAWGKNFDRGFFGIGVEYDYRDAIRLKDRKFFQGCDTDYEVTDKGEIRRQNISDDAFFRSQTGGLIGAKTESCKQFIGAAAIVIPSIYDSVQFFQPAGSTTGVPGGNAFIPNFSLVNDAFGTYLDENGDGLIDVDYADYNISGQTPNQTFIPMQKRYNVMAYGEWTFPGAMNLTPFFEANYSRADIKSDTNGAGNIAVFAAGSNPFNPCNITTGVDCGLRDNLYLGIQNIPSLRLATGVSRAAQSYFSVIGDRDNFELTQEQYRGVLGLKGDLPFIGSGWTFETSGVYSRSIGKTIRLGVREDKLAFALGIDPTADFGTDGIFDNNGDGIADDYNGSDSTPPLLGGANGGACNAAGLRNPGAAMPDLLAGCVPVNIFAPSLYQLPFGDFASAAERNYVFGVKEFDTTYEQILGNAFITGDLFQLPAGSVGAVFGLEYRVDSINSTPNDVTANGLFVQQNSDEGAVGSKWIREAFGEIDIPLQANKPGVKELNLNLSGRVTDEEFYGTNFTYAIKANWRPIDPLVFKFSYGTSFRAPNLRENFLAGQTGFFTVVDPCAVPPAAYNALAPVGQRYVAANDDREATTLANCVREGRDPTRVGIDPSGVNTTQQVGAETLSGGSLDIQPETSRSITAGFAFEETLAGIDLSLGFNYYDIKLKDSIIEPSSQFIVNDCFTRDDGTRSPFCDRLTYDTDAASSRLLISTIDTGFLNLNQEGVRGIDLNSNFGKDIIAFGRNIELDLNLRANHLIERSSLFINDLGEPDFEDDAGEFGFPKWTGFATFTAEVDAFRFLWQTRYIGPVVQDATGIDPLSDAFGYGPDGQETGFIGQTCLGGGSRNANGVPDGVVAGDGVYCRDIGYAGDYFTHTASIRYQTDRYTFLAGVDNIFNRAPPLVDGNEVFSIANTAIGNGYDYDGREFFASVEVKF